jgi:hypothetical protein
MTVDQLKRRIDRIDRRLRQKADKKDVRRLERKMDARFAQIDARFAQMDARFSQIDARFEHLQRALERLNRNFPWQARRTRGDPRRVPSTSARSGDARWLNGVRQENRGNGAPPH